MTGYRIAAIPGDGIGYALGLAAARRRHLTSATKSNGIIHTLVFWDEVVAERAAAYPDITVKSELIDALCAKLVLEPHTFDVIVGSNLFGDILGDIAAAVAGEVRRRAVIVRRPAGTSARPGNTRSRSPVEVPGRCSGPRGPHRPPHG
jgi:isocitrate/isopropylmalate dehydrogenase